MSQAGGLTTGRVFTAPKSKAYDQLKWNKRDSIIVDSTTNESVFVRRGVEFPESWSPNSINMVAQKYLTVASETSAGETSLRHLIDRVVDTITRQGSQEAYFETDEEAENFREELKYALATQRATFSSSVWLNIGVPDRPQQASTCFILGVEDTVESILNWYREEGVIVRGGASAGINLSPIRSSGESLSGDKGVASGPVNYIQGIDSLVGAIGGNDKMLALANAVTLSVGHPDIEQFVQHRVLEERKAYILRQAGFDVATGNKGSSFVRVTDDFMRAVENDDNWHLTAVDTDNVVNTVKARELFHDIAEAAWESGTPGLQFDAAINRWHTTPKAGRINASSPSGEYLHLDDSACNLANINLLMYVKADGAFDVDAFKHTVELVFTAQEILVGYSAYPTESIARNAKAYRELGLGYSNLGALLMVMGLSYDSDEGRAVAAAITALMTGHAYTISARMARSVGPFAGYRKDREAMLNVLRMHRSEISKIDASLVPEELLNAAVTAWDEAVELSELYGVRNSQVTAIGASRDISDMMGCDTLGIEPGHSLMKRERAADGISMMTVGDTVKRALRGLGYANEQVDDIVAHLRDNNTLLNAPHFKAEHLNIFAHAIGDKLVPHLSYLKMMSMLQPFISGALGQTVHMSEEVAIEDVEQTYLDAWRSGIKTISVYRENCGPAQPPSLKEETVDERQEPTDFVRAPSSLAAVVEAVDSRIVVNNATHHDLPRRRHSTTYKFNVAGLKGFVTVGEYEDGTPGELFINVSKQGSTLRGLMDALSTSISYGLQYGVPLKAFVEAMMSTNYAPSGITDDPEVRTVASITDYIARRLALDYLSSNDRLELGLGSPEDQKEHLTRERVVEEASTQTSARASSTPRQGDSLAPPLAATATAPVTDSAPNGDPSYTAPLCYNCGSQTQRSGNYYVCNSCGSTTGCS